MTGGLMQLVAYGSQDIYLTGNPQMTYFKVVYKRHTNFAMESIEQTYLGDVKYGNKFICKLSRSGDLLGRVYFEVKFDDIINSNYFGYQIIDYIELDIGGTIVEKHYGDWIAIWCDLTHNIDQNQSLLRLTSGDLSNNVLYIPLQFGFCRNPGLYLPLIALQYHEVKLNIKLNNKPVGAPNIEYFNIYADYIFLDNDERIRYAQNTHEYLIEQVQRADVVTVNSSTINKELKLKLYHPVKELIWTIGEFNEYIECKDVVLQMNGFDRFKKRIGAYFHSYQRYQYHSGYGDLRNVHLYSFALKPESHQPSGTCNFSRVNEPKLLLSFESGAIIVTSEIKVYAINYNVLRIMSGMGSVAYAN